MNKKRCRGVHPLLVLIEANAMGGVVRCCVCGDEYQASENVLAEWYSHAVETVPGFGCDRDFFIHESLTEGL